MRVSAPAAAAALATIMAGCAPRPVVVPPVDASDRLAAADALVAEGCYDCLVEALAAFDRIAATPNLTPASADGAAAGQVHAAMLLNLRERELGMLDEGYLRKARDVLAAHPNLPAGLGEAVDILDSVAWRIPEASGVSDDDRFRGGQEARRSREAWTAALLPRAGDDAFSAYAWLAYACSAAGRPRSNPDDVRAIYAPAEPQAAAGLVVFKKTICPIVETPGLESLLAADPRFVEINYYLSLADSRSGALDKADEYLAAAYGWHPRWPAVTIARAGIAISQEDFSRALALYDETLAMLPGQRDALLGRVESLSYLGRNEDAVAAATTVLEGDWYRGEAFYWRSWNEAQLERNDDAWADIDEAWKLYVNGDVAKLYGILALHRLDLDKAQAMFEEGRRLKPNDCEIRTTSASSTPNGATGRRRPTSSAARRPASTSAASRSGPRSTSCGCRSTSRRTAAPARSPRASGSSRPKAACWRPRGSTSRSRASTSRGSTRPARSPGRWPTTSSTARARATSFRGSTSSAARPLPTSPRASA